MHFNPAARSADLRSGAFAALRHTHQTAGFIPQECERPTNAAAGFQIPLANQCPCGLKSARRSAGLRPAATSLAAKPFDGPDSRAAADVLRLTEWRSGARVAVSPWRQLLLS